MCSLGTADYERIMRDAISLAKTAVNNDCVPIGAIVLSLSGEVIGKGYNGIKSTEHAEMIAINEALNTQSTSTSYDSDKLRGATIITTLEPCIMCAGAIMNTQIDKVIFGAWDDKFGASGSVWDLLRDPRAPHKPEVYGGVLADECSEMLQNFFAKLR